MMEFPLVKIEVFIPPEYVEKLGDALSEVGAGRIGNYDHCLSSTPVRGYWRPLAGAQPYLGQVGEIETAEESKVEVTCRWELVADAVRKIREVHPYEEPVINVIPLLNHFVIGG
ncbi:MAG TPA: YqfO family protein [Anaerolineaceae bacterium]|nr:YqfO family protein [Anaerolineaceae bacterium]